MMAAALSSEAHVGQRLTLRRRDPALQRATKLPAAHLGQDRVGRGAGGAEERVHVSRCWAPRELSGDHHEGRRAVEAVVRRLGLGAARDVLLHVGDLEGRVSSQTGVAETLLVNQGRGQHDVAVRGLFALAQEHGDRDRGQDADDDEPEDGDRQTDEDLGRSAASAAGVVRARRCVLRHPRHFRCRRERAGVRVRAELRIRDELRVRGVVRLRRVPGRGGVGHRVVRGRRVVRR